MKKISLCLLLLACTRVSNSSPEPFEMKCEPTMGRKNLPLHAAGIIEGSVPEFGILKPLRERVKGAWIESYVFSGNYPEHLWCGYGPKHEVLVSQSLPSDVKSCRVYYRPGPEAIDTKIDKIYCKRRE